jgi:hypothetical protein
MTKQALLNPVKHDLSDIREPLNGSNAQATRSGVSQIYLNLNDPNIN